MKKNPIAYVLVAFLAAVLPQRLYAEQFPKPAQLFATLPDSCPTPDAFAIAGDGSLTLSCPNYADKATPGLLMRLADDGSVSKLAEIPGKNQGSIARPMGLAYAPDGSLYVCDASGGRLLRLTFEAGKLSNTETVASGLGSPNGLRYHQGALYVTVPKLPKIKTEKLTSGVYRFMASDRDVSVNCDASDLQLIFTAQTQNPDRQFGLDGLVFDPQGNLLVADFGDGTVYQLSLDSEGQVSAKEIYAKLPNTAGADGMTMDESGNLYIAGFSQNQIFKVTPDRKVSILAQYPDNDGSDGQLDQPADLLVYGNKLVISNFDLMVQKGMINSKHSKPFTISYIPLGE